MYYQVEEIGKKKEVYPSAIQRKEESEREGTSYRVDG